MAREDLSYIYNTQSYSWDGKDRPQISNYTAPWSAVASKAENKWNTKYGRNYNSAIAYAKNQLQNAISQYNSDVDYWNEQDARRYNSPVSQSERYEDAGYNMGYLYGSVSSGNTNSGYSTPEASSDVKDNEAGESLTTEVILPMIETLGDLANQGIDIWKTIKEIDILNWESEMMPYKLNKVTAESGLAIMQEQWYEFLRNRRPDGTPVGFDKDSGFSRMEDSIAFLSESLGYSINSAEYQDLTAWLKYCEKAYNNETTEPIKELFQDIDSSDMNDAVKTVLKVLAYWATSGNFSVRGNIGGRGKKR